MVTWAWKSFEALSKRELYDILRARQQIFVVEQSCCYLDVDGADLDCWHLIGTTAADGLVAYLRVLPPLGQRSDPKLGRVLVMPHVRGRGWGRLLIAEGMRHTQQQFPTGGMVLSAQHHLQKLYLECGFLTASEPYLEDGILHIDMRWLAR